MKDTSARTVFVSSPSIRMYIVAIAWAFVVALMTQVEATSSQGTVLGALFTLLLYGVLPLGVVLYILGTPARRRARQRAAEAAVAISDDPDGSSVSARVPIAPKREEA